MSKLQALFNYSRLAGRLLLCNLIVRPCLRRPKYNKKYQISICGIFKNEAPYLKEWVEYHEMIGIDHFYLYNNKSEDGYLNVLQPYIDRGLITLVDWPYDQAQIKAYRHFYETYRHETQWVSYLDIDEFFCPRYDKNLSDWLFKNDKYPVLLIYWRMFGTSGKLYHNADELVISQYTVSWDHLYHCGKCLINTDYDIAEFTAVVHHLPKVRFPLFGRFLTVSVLPANQFGWFIEDPWHLSALYSEKRFSIQVNHYWSKAWDVYEGKRRMTDVFYKKNPKLDLSYFYEHEHENRVMDHTIYRFLMQLKLKMGFFKETEHENI